MIHDALAMKAVRSELFYVEHGPREAPLILLLHGITGSHRYWISARKYLEKHYHLLIPDLLGFGESPKPHIRYTIEVFRDSIRNLLVKKRLEDRKLIILGHSLGALIAAEYAVAYPSHIDRLALVSIPLYANESYAHDLFWKGSPSYRNLLASNAFNKNFSQIKRSGLGMSLLYMSKIPTSVVLDCRKFTFRSLTSTLENCLLRYNAEQILDRISAFPILAIQGEKDQVSPVENIIDIQERLPHISLKLIKGSGHHIVLTHTAECMKEVLNFLADGKGPSNRPHEPPRTKLFNQIGKCRTTTKRPRL